MSPHCMYQVPPALLTHLYTRQKVREPTKGSVMILKASALKGASSFAGRVIATSASSAATPAGVSRGGVVCALRCREESRG